MLIPDVKRTNECYLLHLQIWTKYKFQELNEKAVAKVFVGLLHLQHFENP